MRCLRHRRRGHPRSPNRPSAPPAPRGLGAAGRQVGCSGAAQAPGRGGEWGLSLGCAWKPSGAEPPTRLPPKFDSGLWGRVRGVYSDERASHPDSILPASPASSPKADLLHREPRTRSQPLPSPRTRVRTRDRPPPCPRSRSLGQKRAAETPDANFLCTAPLPVAFENRTSVRESSRFPQDTPGGGAAWGDPGHQWVTGGAVSGSGLGLAARGSRGAQRADPCYGKGCPAVGGAGFLALGLPVPDPSAPLLAVAGVPPLGDPAEGASAQWWRGPAEGGDSREPPGEERRESPAAGTLLLGGRRGEAAALWRSRAGTGRCGEGSAGEQLSAGSGGSAQRRLGKAREGEERPCTRWPRGRDAALG